MIILKTRRIFTLTIMRKLATDTIWICQSSHTNRVIHVLRLRSGCREKRFCLIKTHLPYIDQFLPLIQLWLFPSSSAATFPDFYSH